MDRNYSIILPVIVTNTKYFSLSADM